MIGSSTSVRPEPSRTAGCVAFPDAARLIWTRPIHRSPITALGKASLTKAELVSHVAAERMVGAVFSAIASVLAWDEPVAITGLGPIHTLEEQSLSRVYDVRMLAHPAG